MVKMRVLQLLLAASLSIFSVAAKKSPSAFDIYQKKQFPITLNEQQYDELTSVPRDYYSAVVLTALDAKYACGICREFQPEWDVIGKSWQKGDKKGQSRVLFATLDFDQGRNVFMKVCKTVFSMAELTSYSTNCKLHPSSSSFLPQLALMPRLTANLRGLISLVHKQQKVSTVGSSDSYQLVTILNSSGRSTGANSSQLLRSSLGYSLLAQ